MNRSKKSSLYLNPLPNPYQVPDRPFTLDFIIRRPYLPRPNVGRRISHSMLTILELVRQGGQLLGNDLTIKYDHILFGVYPHPLLHQLQLTYNDSIAILEAFELKT